MPPSRMISKASKRMATSMTRVKWSKFTAYQPKQTCVQRLGIVASVRVEDDGTGNPVLYFPSGDGFLYKLNGGDGSQIWKSVVQVPSGFSFAWPRHEHTYFGSPQSGSAAQAASK